jgi:hypothetical protein
MITWRVARRVELDTPGAGEEDIGSVMMVRAG